MGRLHEAFEEALDVRGESLDPALVRLSGDFATLLVRQRGMDVGVPEKKALDEVLAARTGLSPEVRAVLLELALAPQYRTELGDAEVSAFTDRFGVEAGGWLRAEQQAELDLAGFAGRYGAPDALMLLDSLFRVAVADGEIDEDEARRLESAALALGVDGVLLSALFQRYDPRHAAGEISWPMTGDSITVGRSAGNDVVLSDPQVARHHCTFVRAGDTWRVVDARSGRPVLVDGQPVDSRPLNDSSVVRIGPWELRVAGDVLQGFGHRSFTALSVSELDRKIGDICLLEGVSFSVFSGELVALVGPSGAGKTTLINAIAGIAPADSGEVELGGRDFHHILENDPSAVGMVPQDDLVHPELRVEESLYYSGRLRYSGDVKKGDVQGEVDRVLRELDIEHIRDSRIGDALKRGISGGQRKRVNLGQELLTRTTRVLFLDEPTSGLDPKSAQSITRQVRQLADQGRIVFLVTHDLSPAIMELVDHLLVMLPGGRLGYFGPPREACRFFSVASPDLIFDVLGRKEPTEWAAEFRESADFKKYVTTREHLLATEEKAPEPTEERKPPGALTQWLTMTARYAKTKLRDKAGLLVLCIQPPVLALLIWLVFPVPTTRLMFMLSLSCLWFGMSIGVRELIIDRTIWRRERKVGIGVTPYLGSKLLVLGALNALQCFAFTAIVHQSMFLGKYGYSLIELSGASIVTGLVGMTLGLMLSALYTSSEAAVGTLPLLLIPNICFSSIMVSLRDMTVLPKSITWVTMQRYAFDLMLKVGTHLEEPSRIPGKWDKKPITGPLYELGLKPADVDDIGLEVPELIGALGAFAGVFLVVTWIATWARDRS
ncbi:MAG: ATP-binding cassette domain-containing protein [Proteobacteria bacterium]|nr:ATP-binding cassette domain-containing protein [Pseudomonadota bacterium]MCP4919618.1 ATP-binding cassette domain-containing protein [Pseudomonadota bacterium]